MLSEAERVSLSDILTNIDFAQNFVEGLDYEAFLTDTRTFYGRPVALRLSPKRRAACLPR
jgi:uncharacterized protein with HEPN domain